MTNDTRTPAEIERDIEAERAHLTSNLDEIQERFSFDGLVREASAQLRTHGGEISQTLAESVKRNPVALAVTGVGLAWLIFGSSRTQTTAAPAYGAPYRGDAYGDDPYRADRRPLSRYSSAPLPRSQPDYEVYDTEPSWARNVGDLHDYDYDDDDDGPSAADRAKGAAHDAADRAKGAAQEARDRASATGAAVSASASRTAGSIRDRAERAGDRLSDRWNAAKEGAGEQSERARAAYDRMRRRVAEGTEHLSAEARDRVVAARMRAVEARNSARRTMRQGAERAGDAFDEQPLVFGALALAVGAAIGGALPRTAREDALMGEYSDSLMHEAEAIFNEELDRAKRVGSAAVDEAKKVASEEKDKIDSKADGDKTAADEAVDDAKAAGQRIADRARDEANKDSGTKI
ncbi:hypothetical protein OCGS_1193 [Oceaniovalibus guishaninsula JLT2003]|uniref:DUF3618 domain-containing protein n=1 Tax=Oceaniovalibus guishaninsula JLT2003 TaxID=1231392 RepID=K2I5U6_9RHOB|nr:DUF3618 domain-containing protein [Oceaniovalibus guishaninsula]EKE44355.1 hypothetical protein OCGS_1193 [Oceaniovalibus guishaninsula JLT2003]